MNIFFTQLIIENRELCLVQKFTLFRDSAAMKIVEVIPVYKNDNHIVFLTITDLFLFYQPFPNSMKEQFITE